jgi:hypothetical protein
LPALPRANRSITHPYNYLDFPESIAISYCACSQERKL